MTRIALLLLLPVAYNAGAVVIRHDVDDSQYRVAASAFSALADLPTEGHGVLIAPQWVVTAAHAAAWQSQVKFVVVNGTSRLVEKVIFHPGYKKLPQDMMDEAMKSGDASAAMAFIATSDDIALLRLALPVTDVAPAKIHDGDLLGKTVRIVGKGATATGATGHEPNGPNRTDLRHAFNTVSRSQGRWLSYVFDRPPHALPLEGMAGNGDSGGPVLVAVGDQWRVAGLTSWKQVDGNPATFRPGKYGQTSHALRLGHYLAWIKATISAYGAATKSAVEAPGKEEHHAQALLERVREQYKLPGLAAVVVSSDTMLDLAVTGVRRQGQPDRVEPGDRFHLGSMGKAITATVIARLVEEGKIAWTTRPLDVFPELAETIHPGYRNITLEQLLRHQAGTPKYDSHAEMAAANARAGSGSPRDQRREFSIWLLQQRPQFTPGTRLAYSNAGYPVAAAMAEAATGEAWTSLVESRLALPLGIDLVYGLPAGGHSPQPWGHKPKSAFSGMATHQNAVEPQPPETAGLSASSSCLPVTIRYRLRITRSFLQLHLAGLRGP